MENPRTTSARDHDDSAMIDAASELPTPSAQGSSGGNLATDMASQGEEAEVGDPEARTRPEKADDIANDQSFSSTRARG